MVNLSLILPAHNEEAVIEQAVLEALNSLDHLGYQGEVLVVDDGSTDHTALTVQRLRELHPRVRLLRHDRNRGYGAALRTGFEAAKCEFVAFTDADCQFHLEDLSRLVSLMEDHDLVTGWRQDRKDPAFRKFLSKGFNCLVGGMLGIGVKDVDCALKVFRKDSLGKILPKSKGFFANTEMLVKARQNGLRVGEAGVRHRPRAAGLSKVNLGAIPRVLSRLMPFWWGEVLHKNPESTAQNGGKKPTLRDPWTWVALVAVLILSLGVFGLGNNAPLMEPTEARNAQIAKEMLIQGEWVVPLLEGKAYLDKPPLLYWMLMGLFQVGGDTDHIARLAPMIWCTGMVLGIWFWTGREINTKVAFLSALALALCLPFIHYGRLLAMDGLLGFWLLAAMVATFEANRNKRLDWRWWIGAACCLALAGLTKGPIAYVLFFLPMTAIVVVDERFRKPGVVAWGLFFAVSALPLLFWAILVERIHTGFIADFLYTHHLVRFSEPIDHEEPFWFYLPIVTVFSLPWSLALMDLGRSYFRAPKAKAPDLPSLAGVAALCFFSGLIFFSAAGCKRPGYLVPLFPYLGIMGGVLLDRWTRKAPDLVTLLGLVDNRARVFSGCSLTVGAVFMVIAAARQMIPVSGAVLLGSVFGAGALFAFGAPLKFRSHLSWGNALLASVVVVLAGVAYLLPGYNEQFSIKSPLEDLEGGEPATRLVICYPQRFYSTSFYSPEATVAVFGHHEHAQLFEAMRDSPGAVVLVKTGNAWKNLQKDAPAGWRWQSSTVPGHFRAIRRDENSPGDLAQLSR